MTAGAGGMVPCVPVVMRCCTLEFFRWTWASRRPQPAVSPLSGQCNASVQKNVCPRATLTMHLTRWLAGRCSDGGSGRACGCGCPHASGRILSATSNPRSAMFPKMVHMSCENCASPARMCCHGQCIVTATAAEGTFVSNITTSVPPSAKSRAHTFAAPFWAPSSQIQYHSEPLMTTAVNPEAVGPAGRVSGTA
jgi:hypothetical protein